jgi:hypothetical protein
MEDNEQLKLIDFADPLIQLAIGMAVAADILFIIIPVRYILAVIAGAILYPKTRGFITKLIFLIGLILPLPLLTIATILAMSLTNSFVRGVVTAVAVSVVTGGVGTLAEAGILAAKIAAQEVASRGAEKVAKAVGGEKAGKIAGTVAGAAVSKGLAKGKGGAAAKTGAAGPAAQPPEMKGPQAQPEEVKRPSFKERVKERVIKKGKEELAEKLAEEGGPEEEREEEEEESNVIEGEFRNPDVVNLENESDEGTDEETIDLRKAA